MNRRLELRFSLVSTEPENQWYNFLNVFFYCRPKACSGRLGSLLHEDQDAQWFAANGVDFLKYDSCDDGKSGLEVEERYDMCLLFLGVGTGKPRAQRWR